MPCASHRSVRVRVYLKHWFVCLYLRELRYMTGKECLDQIVKVLECHVMFRPPYWIFFKLVYVAGHLEGIIHFVKYCIPSRASYRSCDICHFSLKKKFFFSHGKWLHSLGETLPTHFTLLLLLNRYTPGMK